MTDDEKRRVWLLVGAEPQSSTLATAITAVILASAVIMYLTVAV